ncbi:hypothetical protein RJ639_026825 [Escallonia herrerae]|uniref:DUF7054 domain-containing protein n=1 Tax=Escallonia herrerae TaxID=1293975 RepID=A0AA88X6V8_9ASTE|nr:hypothetical protein RJ639_026825 [Escallonia herrerae]
MFRISKQLSHGRRNSAVDGGRVAAEAHSEPIRERGGVMPLPKKLTPPLEAAGSRRTPKVLHKVDVQRSFGPVQVVISPECTVGDLIKAVIELYVKEKRRPLLAETDSLCFELHYSQFSLQSLKAEEKLLNLGSRNFFLCPKHSNAANASCSCSYSYSDEAKAEANSLFPLAKFMDFLP